MSVLDLIIRVVALIWGVSTLITFVGVPFIEWILMPWHQRRTGRDLIEPMLPMPGQSALTLGLCLISQRFHRRTHYVLTIDLAPRWWRWIVLATTWSAWGFLVSLIAFILLEPNVSTEIVHSNPAVSPSAAQPEPAAAVSSMTVGDCTAYA